MIAEAMLSPCLDGISGEQRCFVSGPAAMAACKGRMRKLLTPSTALADRVGVATDFQPARIKQWVGSRDRHVNACRVGVVVENRRRRQAGLRRRAALHATIPGEGVTAPQRIT
jgi:hypothetical protein